jgi:hypothetical protein
MSEPIVLALLGFGLAAIIISAFEQNRTRR